MHLVKTIIKIPHIIIIIDTSWAAFKLKKSKLSVLSPSIKNLIIPYQIKYIDVKSPNIKFFLLRIRINNIKPIKQPIDSYRKVGW